MNYAQEIKTAAAKRPIVPSGGYFSTPFEAYTALGRLLSMPNKNSRDITDCLSGILASSKSVMEDSTLVTPAYKLISMLPPYFDDISIVSSTLEALQPPTDLLAREVADSNATGRMAAVILMSSKTPTATVDRLVDQWQLKSNILATERRYRANIISQIIETNNDGVMWNNHHFGNIVCNIIKRLGWNSEFSQTLLHGLKHFPFSMMVYAINDAPSNIANDIIQNEMMSIDTADQLQYLLKLIPVNQQDAAVGMLSNFMTSSTIQNNEKIEMYNRLISSGQSHLADRTIRAMGMKAFASNKSQITFDVAREKIENGLDTESIKEFTGNLEFSLLDCRAIVEMLKTIGKLDQADPRFCNVFEAMKSTGGANFDSNLDYFFDEWEERFAASYGWNEMEIKKDVKSSKRAVAFAALLVAIGIPMSIALFRANVTTDEFASNPDSVRTGTRAGHLSTVDQEIALKVQRFVDSMTNTVAETRTSPGKMSNQPASPVTETQKKTLKTKTQPQTNQTAKIQEPPAKPDPNAKQDCEVTRQLIDTIITLEHVPGKDLSSKGAGGLMQLMPKTWEEINQKQFGGKYPFNPHHTNDWVNKRFGTIYLQQLKDYLDNRKAQWKTDQLPLIFACYFGGIGNISTYNFDPAKIKKYAPKTYDYMMRGTSLMGQEVKQR